MADIYRVLSREEALTFLELVREYHQGKRRLPREIEKKREEIEAAIQNAELFLLKLRVVDHGMMDHVVELKLELDALLGQWAQSGTSTLH